MRLLASTDIALRVLMVLGRGQPDQHLYVERLARELGDLSRNHLHKIVQDLAALGILRTLRGAGGGVQLAKPLNEIRLGALVRELECDQAIVECFRADGGCCAIEAGCRLRFMLRAAHESFYETLDRHTLADCALGASRGEAKAVGSNPAPTAKDHRGAKRN
jgi:Rrf2 family transcriptional regulator, nitric oxide-sensitive transcriptional repressor